MSSDYWYNEQRRREGAYGAYDYRTQEAQQRYEQEQRERRQREHDQQMAQIRQNNRSNADSTVICTELHRQGRLSRKDYLACAAYSQQNWSDAQFVGYHSWAISTVRGMRKSKTLSRMILPVIELRADAARAALRGVPSPTLRGLFILKASDRLCAVIGQFAKPKDVAVLKGSAAPSKA